METADFRGLEGPVHQKNREGCEATKTVSVERLEFISFAVLEP